eukprot:scaffold18571_cov61-Phaeocystis_antarctica.AAC.2
MRPRDAARRLPPSISRRRPRCRCPFLTSSSGHAAARLSGPTRPSTPRCASWRVCRGSASRQEEPQQLDNHLLYLYFGLEIPAVP